MKNSCSSRVLRTRLEGETGVQKTGSQYYYEKIRNHSWTASVGVKRVGTARVSLV
jgi:hypothetical protein